MPTLIFDEQILVFDMGSGEVKKTGLSAIACEKLKYHGDDKEGKKKNYLCDDLQYEGLRIVANKNKTKSWRYRYKSLDSDKGHVKQVTFAQYPNVGLSEARAELLELKGVRARGIDPAEFVKKKKRERINQSIKEREERITLSDVFDFYLDRDVKYRNTKEETKQQNKNNLYHHKLKKYFNTEVSNISRRDFSDVFNSMQESCRSQLTKTRPELYAAFRYCIDHGFLSEDFKNPIPYVSVSHSSDKKEIYFNDQEIVKLINWLPKSKLTVKARVTACLVLLTGCRSGEVIAMDWRDVDFEEGIWLVKETKNKKIHKVFLSPLVKKIIDNIQFDRRKHWVFPSRKGGHVGQKAAGDPVGKYRDDLGLGRKWTLHDLRRTLATGIGELGCPWEVEQRILNHTIPGPTSRYIRSHRDEKAKEWWFRWSDHILSLVSEDDIMKAVGHNKTIG